ncbi:OmpA family protein [Wenyingzhuangia sp. IMCC45533]
MKKTLFLLGMLSYSLTFAQDCCNVVDGSGETVVSSNGVCVSAPNLKCPDTDGDGFLDKVDECPTVPGTVNGCPDADKDGVADKDDNCPNVAGTLNGCPDADKDGIADKDDKCPNEAGPASQQGCPDADKDGVYGSDDKCPTQAGPAANQGCPWPDTDGDGILDKDDKCPNKAGVASENGCPAKLSVEAKATLGKYAKTIQFNTGKATFKPGVAKTLDKVAKVMNEFKEVTFDVEGHSDSTGNDDNNLKLSQRRAQAVVDYLATHGIDGARLHAVGYGETKPIASNKTRAGRAQNRRVVLTAKE